MLVRSAADKPAPEDDFREFRGERFQAYWIGFLYLPGYRGGSDSLAALEKLAGEIGIPGAVSRLKGMFFCMLRDGSTGELHLFVDNCGLRAAYRTAGTVSTSFLELIRSDPAQCGEISRRAVVEFLELGGYYYQRSLMTGVAAIAREEIITFRPDTGGYTVTKKTEVDVESAYRFDRHEYFRTLAHALSGSTVHIDLTGGIVSRYTAVMLQHYGLEFSVGLASTEDHPDARISKAVADVLQVTHRLMPHGYEDLETELRETVEKLDGMGDPVNMHRLANYCQLLKCSGVSVNLNSIGETFKDWIWYQDFPFYGVKKTNFPRLFAYRICPVRLPSHLWHGEMRGEVEQWKEEFIRQLDQFRCEYNTQSYDKFIAVGKCQANIRASMTFRSRFIDMAVPFMDTELVREAMRMRSWSRFMDAVYRRDITAVNPAAAKVRTTHGLTASSRKSDVTLDSCRAVRFYGERFLKAAGRKFFGKSLFLRWADVPQLRQDVVRTRLYHDSLSRLKQMRIIAENAEPVQLAPQSGRVICLAVVLDSLVDRPLHVG